MASGCITSWEIDGETVADFIFGGSKITADGDCSHEIKRYLPLGRKVMTNLGSIFKSRDITLPTKVCLVKVVKVKVTQSCPTRSDPMDCSPWNSPGQNSGVGSLSLLQGIFPTLQRLNSGLPHCRQILYQLSEPQEKPKGSQSYSFSSSQIWM